MLDARTLMLDARDLQGKHARARSMLETQCSYLIDARKKSTQPITNVSCSPNFTCKPKKRETVPNHCRKSRKVFIWNLVASFRSPESPARVLEVTSFPKRGANGLPSAGAVGPVVF